MAAYAATVTLAQPTVHKIGKLGILRGTIDVTNYNPTLAAIVEITSRFKGAPTVLLGGTSSNGYGVAWIPASSSVKAFEDNENATYLADQAFGEVAADVAVGTVEFVAFGVAP
jgi:hypothetical protein